MVSDDKAQEVFNNITEYAKVIRQTVGYFVYDPQTDKVYDPMTENIFGIDIYQSMTDQVERMRDEQLQRSNKKGGGNFGKHKLSNNSKRS